MAGPASVFREIHRLRRFLRDAQEQIDRIPRQRKAYQAKLAKVEQALAEEKEAIKKLKVLGAEREKTLKATEEQTKRYRTQLESAANKKISDALTLEIAAARERCSKLEDEILGAISEGEDRQAKVPEMEAAAATVRADLARYEADVAPRKAMLDANVQQSQARLAEQEKLIPTTCSTSTSARSPRRARTASRWRKTAPAPGATPRSSARCRWTWGASCS